MAEEVEVQIEVAVWPPHSKAPSKRIGATNEDVICELNDPIMTAGAAHARADQLHGNLSCARARTTPVLHISKVASALTPGSEVSRTSCTAETQEENVEDAHITSTSTTHKPVFLPGPAGVRANFAKIVVVSATQVLPGRGHVFAATCF